VPCTWYPYYGSEGTNERFEIFVLVLLAVCVAAVILFRSASRRDTASRFGDQKGRRRAIRGYVIGALLLVPCAAFALVTCISG
jgi:ABC-type Fe3+ transport system permease subunit